MPTAFGSCSQALAILGHDRPMQRLSRRRVWGRISEEFAPTGGRSAPAISSHHSDPREKGDRNKIALLRDAWVLRGDGWARAKSRRRADVRLKFAALEDRTVLSPSVVSAVGIGGTGINEKIRVKARSTRRSSNDDGREHVRHAGWVLNALLPHPGIRSFHLGSPLLSPEDLTEASP
jgi:hypothetical protein